MPAREQHAPRVRECAAVWWRDSDTRSLPGRENNAISIKLYTV